MQTQTTNPASNAAVALQMLLPGTINLNLQFDESDSKSQPNQDFNPEALKNMTTLRALAIPIYMNGNYKRQGYYNTGWFNPEMRSRAVF